MVIFFKNQVSTHIELGSFFYFLKIVQSGRALKRFFPKDQQLLCICGTGIPA